MGVHYPRLHTVQNDSDFIPLCTYTHLNKGEILTTYVVKMINSVHYVIPDRPFTMLVCNFSASHRIIHKGIIICYDTRSPIALISLIGAGSEEMCVVLKMIPTTTDVD